MLILKFKIIIKLMVFYLIIYISKLPRCREEQGTHDEEAREEEAREEEAREEGSDQRNVQ